MIKLTLNEQKVYSSIRDYIGKYNRSPTMDEIKDITGIKNLTTIHRAIAGLEAKKWINKIPNVSRGISLIGNKAETFDIPILGTVACGTPLFAEENIEGYIQTDRHFIKDSPDKYFYLHAVGNSMDKKNIIEGDLLLIHSQSYADDNKIVLALINDSATIKVLRRRKGFVMLEPQSSDDSHKPIILKEDFKIQGVVEKNLKDIN